MPVWAKPLSPMAVTVEGRASSPLMPDTQKAFLPIAVTPSGMVTLLMPLHPKLPSGTSVMVSAKDTEPCNFPHLSNALAPRVTSVSAMVPSNLTQPSNALSPTALTVSGIWNVWRFFAP